jgi:hypothetical protein
MKGNCSNCGKYSKYLIASGLCDSCDWFEDKRNLLLFMDWFINSHNQIFLKYYKEFRNNFDNVVG